MVQDTSSGSLRPFDFEHISEQVPELERFHAQLDAISFPVLFDSSNMHPEIWIKIATTIFENYEQYNGFVILHGSDTMAFTASALSFMLENLSKPVILTGSQLPVGEIRTDAKENLITSIEIASTKNSSLSEVCIFFDYQLYRGNRATKYSSEKFEAFRSVNYPVLAEAGVSIKYNSNYFFPTTENPLRLYSNLDDNLGILKLYPGISQSMVNAVLNTPGLRAIILETFGAGNASTRKEFIDSLERAIEKGIIIYDVTQCLGGRVELGKYETSVQLKNIGVISGSDITTEAAVAKLMFLLGQNIPTEEVKQKLSVSLRGEMQ